MAVRFRIPLGKMCREQTEGTYLRQDSGDAEQNRSDQQYYCEICGEFFGSPWDHYMDVPKAKD